MEDIEGVLRSVINEASKKTNGESKPGPVPKAGSMPSEMTALLGDIQTAMVESDAAAKATVARTKADIAKTDLFTDMIVESGKTLAEANKKIQLQKDIGSLQIQDDANTIRDAAGGLDFQVAQIGSLADSQKKTIELQAEKADILDDEFTGVGIFDAAINMFRVGNLSSQIEKSQRKSAGTTNQIQQLTQSQESFGRVNTQAARTVTKGTIAAGQTAIAAQASIDESKARLSQVFSNGEAYAAAENASGNQVKNMIRQLDIYNGIEDRAVRNAEIALRKQQLEAEKVLLEFKVPAAKLSAEQSAVNLRISKLTAKRAEVDASKEGARADTLDRQIVREEQQAILLQAQVDSIPTNKESKATALKTAEANLTIMQQTIGMSPFKIATAKLTVEKLQIEAEDRARRRAAMVVNVQKGQAIAGLPIELEDAVIMSRIEGGGITGRLQDLLMEIGTSGDIGQDPATSRANLANLGNYTPTDGTRLLEEATVLQNNLGTNDPTYKRPNTVEGIAAEFNQVARAHYKSKELNIATGDNSNPLHAPPFTVLARKKSVSGTALYQKILKNKGMTETNPQIIVDAALAGYLAKDITIEEAKAGVEAIFDQAALSNNLIEGGLARVGFDTQTTYNTRLMVSPTFFEEMRIRAGRIAGSEGTTASMTGAGLAAVVVTAAGAPVTLPVAALSILGGGILGALGSDEVINNQFPESTMGVDLMSSSSINLFFARAMNSSKGSTNP